MKKRFTFVYEFLCGGWSFLCIYADTLRESRKKTAAFFIFFLYYVLTQNKIWCIL